MDPTVRKSFSCPSPRRSRISKTSRLSFPVVQTKTSFYPVSASRISAARSRVIRFPLP